MRRLLTPVLGVMYFAAVPAAAEDIDARKLVGAWELSAGADTPKGTTVEFGKDSTLVMRATIEGREWKLEGTYKVEGDQLTSVIRVQDTDIKSVDTIARLTDDTLELVNAGKPVATLRRKK